MISEILRSIENRFPLTEISAGEYSRMKVNGMNFSIRRYTAQGLGNVSVMEAKGFFGLMRMDTVMVTPFEKDAPLLSYDRIYAMGNDTLILELYDTCVKAGDLSVLSEIKDSSSVLPQRDPGTHWYDGIKLSQSISLKGKKAHGPAFDALTEKYIASYAEMAMRTEDCDPCAKRERSSVYVEGVLENGGPSTDVFKKSLGEEKTAALFREVLFGTK